MQLTQRRLHLSASLLGAWLVLCAAPAHAQFTKASLSGTVADSSGAALAAAAVTVESPDTGFRQQQSTSAQGAFLFPELPVGNYSLTVEKEGFQTSVRPGIVLTVGQKARVDMALTVGSISQRLEVAAGSELVSTDNSTVGQVVSTQQVVNLPLDGRTAQSLVFLSAGTVDTTDRYCGLGCHGGVYPGEQQASVNGSGPGGVNYQLDGAGHNDTYLNTNLPFPNPDAVQEFSLQSSNLTAEYGSAVGGVVNIVTKSGTNRLHGTAFEFLRNGALNARNYFAADHDALKRNQFGGSIGGPILKDKLFFFGTYQGTRIRSSSQGQIAFVPTAAERAGDFSALLPGTQLVDPTSNVPYAGNRVPASQLSPVAAYLLKYIPLPNSGGRKLNYTGAKDQEEENQFMPKVDWVAGKHQISGRYFHTHFNQPPLIDKVNLLAATSLGNAVTVQNVAVSDTWSVKPSLLFSTWFGWNAQTGGSLSSAPFSFSAAGAKIAAPTPPELAMDVGGAFSINTNHNGNFDRGDWTLRENVTLVRGRHEIHLGGEGVRVKNDLVNTYAMAGYFNFGSNLTGDNLADFVLGKVSYFQQGGGEFKSLRGNRFGTFVQDNWRVNPALTVNLGVRWDPFFPYQEQKGRVTCFHPGAQSVRYPNAPLGLTYGGDNHDATCPKAGLDANLGNFAPRIGFALRLTQDGKTSLRGGFGYYYIPIQTSVFNLFVDTAPFSPQFTLNSVDFADPYGSSGIVNPFPSQYGPRVPLKDVTFTTPTSLYGVFQKTFHEPLLTTWNLTLERQIGSSWLTRVSYVGNKGTFLSNDQKSIKESNPAIYIPGASTQDNTQSRRLYSDFSTVGLVTSDSNSKYQSLQFNLEKRFAQGLTLLSNYTWSKTMDDYGWTNPFRRSFDYGLSDDDVQHNAKVSGVWELPKTHFTGLRGAVVNGWTLNGIVNWHSGFPFSILSGLDNSFSGVGRDRADYLGGKVALGNGRSHNAMTNQFFNTAAFGPNAIGTFGNSGKNLVRGPRYFKTDASLLKNFKLTEAVALQFRSEFFNLLNNVNFNAPGRIVSAPDSFGIITSAKDPRIIQFALKILF